ncbi:hypothetical protein TKK_0001073 [Trichogramma kaykai]
MNWAPRQKYRRIAKQANEDHEEIKKIISSENLTVNKNETEMISNNYDLDSTLESNLSIRPEPDTESHALEFLFSTAEPTTSDDLASSSSDHNSTDNNQEYDLFRNTLNFEDIDPTAEFSEVSDENFYECDFSDDDDDYNDFHDDENVEEFNFEQALGD